MALGNNMKDKMSQVTPRQKIIMVVMVVVVLIIIWQIMGLFGGSSSSPSPVIEPVAKKMDASKPGEMNAATATDATTVKSSEAPASAAPPVSTVRQASIVDDPQFSRQQRITEEKYVGKLNELEELRIQRQIAETNQAIAAAKLATVTAEKDISNLLTSPSPEAVQQQAYQKAAAAAEQQASATPAIPPPPPPPATPYRLISVSMLLNKWNAVVELQGAMYSVGVGDTLPPDGSIVTNINKNSITLRKNDKSRKLGIEASI